MLLLVLVVTLVPCAGRVECLENNIRSDTIPLHEGSHTKPMRLGSYIRVCTRRVLIAFAGGALPKTAGRMCLTNIDAGIGIMIALNLVSFYIYTGNRPQLVFAIAANKYLVCCLRS